MTLHDVLFDVRYGLLTMSLLVKPYSLSSFPDPHVAILMPVYQSFSLIVDLRVQARDDLQVLVVIVILAILGNLRRLGAPLLLRLALLNPLLHGQMLIQLGELVRLQTEAIKNGAVGDGIKLDLVVGSVRD